jgi:DNA polymerase III delta subunit
VPSYFAIIAGKDEYLVDQEAQECFAYAKKQAGAEAEIEKISGLLTRVDDARAIEVQFVDSLKTMGMFGGQKVIWLQNFNWVTDSVQAKSEAVKESLALILKAALEASEGVYIIISATPYDGRRKDLSALKDEVDKFVVHSPPAKSPFDKDDAQAEGQRVIVEQVFKKAGVKWDQGVPEAIIEQVGQSTRLVAGEADKLATYAGSRGTVREADVMLLVPRFGEGDFFEPVEAIMARDLEWGLASLERYFFNEDSGRPLISALQNRLRLLIQIKVLAEAGEFRLSKAGLTKGQFETASARHGLKFGSATKSSSNLFSQNAWYISNKVAPAAMHYTLSELVDLQLACGECFDAANRGRDEASVRALFLRALAVRRSV